jgi:hypothetical protein
MPQVIGEIKIDFDVIQSTVQTLWIGDNSDWVHAEVLPANILITLPGSKKAFTFSFKKKALASFNSHNLGITCFTNDCKDEVYADLPDGVYTICLKSGYSNFEKTKYYLKTDRTELELSKVIIKHGFEYSKNDKGFREKVYDIDWLIKVAKSHAKVGDFVKADRFFSESKALLKGFGECLDCI